MVVRISQKAKRLSFDERRRLYADGRELDDPPPLPRTRGDCENAARPCPFARCRHHLMFEVTEQGSLKPMRPGVELEDMPDTCSLDVADRGGLTMEAVAAVLNITKERVGQIEAVALMRLARSEKMRRLL